MSESSLHRPFVPTDPQSHARLSTLHVTPRLAIPPYDTTVLDEIHDLAPDPNALNVIDAPPGADVDTETAEECTPRRYGISQPRGPDAATWDFVTRRLLRCSTGHFFAQLLQQFRSDYHQLRQIHRIIDRNTD